MIDERSALFSELSELFVYPDDASAISDKARKIARWIEKADVPTAMELEAFADHVDEFETKSLQELYVGTFDIGKTTTPYMGHLVLGESFNRGNLLSRLKDTYREYGVEDDTDLPDHIANILKFISVAGTDKEVVQELLTYILLPGILSLLPHLQKVSDENPYYHIFKAVKKIVEPLAVSIPDSKEPES
ncbi:MAG TPA: molecular chaperone TorD family protein [bacterium]|jgi:nitrate reductase delta subunit